MLTLISPTCAIWWRDRCFTPWALWPPLLPSLGTRVGSPAAGTLGHFDTFQGLSHPALHVAGITSENTPSTLQADLSWSDLGAPRPRLSVCPGGHLAVTLLGPACLPSPSLCLHFCGEGDMASCPVAHTCPMSSALTSSLLVIL